MDYRLQRILSDTHTNQSILGTDHISVCCPHPSHPHESWTPSCEVKINNKGGLSVVCHGNCGVDNDTLWKWFVDEYDPDAKLEKKSSFIKSRKKGGPDCVQWHSTLPSGAPALHHFPNSRYFQFMTKENRPMGLVQARSWDPNSNRKTFTTWRYIDASDGSTGWQPESPPDRVKPIYGLEQCNNKDYDKKPMLIVEGEKCSQAAMRYLRQEYFVVAWLGGSKTADFVDWSVIDWVPPKTIIWTDNDVPGFKWAYLGMKNDWNLYDVLKSKGHDVSIVDTSMIQVSGWDIEDAIEEKLNVRQMLMDAKPARYFRLAGVFKYCQWARDTNATEESIAEHTCDSCKYKFCPLKSNNYVKKPSDLSKWSKHPERLNYVYSAELDKVINIQSLSTVKLGPFSNLFAGSNSLSGEAYRTGTGKGSAALEFMSDPRSIKVDTEVFYPGKQVITQYKGKTCFNRWKEIVVPITNKEPEIWLELGRSLFRDELIFNHILDWLAWTIQHPDKKINHGLMIKSKQQGVGKDTFFKPVSDIYSNAQQLGTPTPDALEEPYMDYLMGNKLIIMQEVDSKSKKVYNKLKNMCAAPPLDMDVRRLGAPAIQLPNIWSVIMFSNKDEPLKIEQEDRRWMVWSCDHIEHRDGLFDDVYAEINGNLNAEVWHWLKRRDVSQFDASGRPPETEAKEDLKDESIEAKDELIARVREMIEESVWPFSHDVVRIKSIRKALELEGFKDYLIPKTNRALAKKMQQAGIQRYGKGGIGRSGCDGITSEAAFLVRNIELLQQAPWVNLKDKFPKSPLQPPQSHNSFGM